MSSFDLSTPVGEIVARFPGTSRVFEHAGVDFCCCGKKTLADACRTIGLPVEELVARLEEELAGGADEPDAALADAPLPALCRYIIERFHVPLAEELPRLDRMTARVLEVHGRAYPEIVPELARLFSCFRPALEKHMAREASVLFPAIAALERATGAGDPGVSELLQALEAEHDEAGEALARMRALTADFTPPAGACSTLRALYQGLAGLERELRLHIHLENSILFPRAAARERGSGLRAPLAPPQRSR